MKTSRLAFVRGSVGVCVAGALTAACGGDDDDDDNAGASCKSAIGTNHGHTMPLSSADVMAGVDKTYGIQGSSAHSHTVEITAAAFANMTPGSVYVLESSTDAGHSHEVTITC
jgi:hypothetical protein